MIKYLLALLLVPSIAKSEVRAPDWKFGTLDHLSLDVAKFGCNREPMTPDIDCNDYRGRVRLNFDLGLFNDLIKWKNELHGEGTDSKFQTLGWHYVVSIPNRWGIEPFIEHHSRHTLDSVQPTIAGRTKPEKFAVEDSVGLRIVFYGK